MLIEQLMTNKECYDLFQYGIEGVQYEIKDGKITKPAGFDEKHKAEDLQDGRSAQMPSTFRLPQKTRAAIP